MARRDEHDPARHATTALSRRRFVTISAGAAAAIAVEGCLPPRVVGSAARQRPVVIVGAGIAGLTAGLRLRQAGMPVRLYEAQNRVGGRMFSLRDDMADGQVIEAFRSLAARIEQARAAFPDDEITYRAPGGTTATDGQTLAGWLDAADVRGWLRTLIDVAGMLDDAIHTGHVLEAVRRRDDGVYLCTFRRNSGTVEVKADQVILALSFTLLRKVSLDVELPAPKRRAIDELGYGTNAKLMVGFGERVWRTRHGANGSSLTDLPYQLSWETSRLQAGVSGVLTNFTGGRHGLELGAGTPEEQAALLVADLARVFPGAAAAHVGQRAVRFRWPTFSWTLGSYASYRPGQWTALRGAEGESVDRLHFAGEHCSLPAQGLMEGGCETGEAAAKAVLAAAGIRSASRRSTLRALVGAA